MDTSSVRRYFVVGPDGSETGPHDLGVLMNWASAGTLPANARLRDPESGAELSVMDVPELAQAIRPQSAGLVGGKLIPARNGGALLAYYCGLFSCLPFLGLILAVIALIAGVRGLRAFKADPSVFGKAHAIVGLVCGSIGLAINAFLTFALIVALIGPDPH